LDSDLIDAENLIFTELARFLDHPTEEQVRAWQSRDVVDWVNESHQLSGDCYDFEAGQQLGYPYWRRHVPLVRQRLLQAGIRLAGKLNAIFAGADKLAAIFG
jgi:hypothetical protein